MPSFPIKVLIVDDSPAFRKLLAHIIESSPHLKVIGFAENGEEALKFLQKETPDVITMDIIMPKMDGFETTRRIMQFKPIPIIIISANYSKEDIDKSFKALDAGALAIMEKPVGRADKRYNIMAQSIIESIHVIAEIKFITQSRSSLLKKTDEISKGKSTPLLPKTRPSLEIDIIGIGASLGGPQAISHILSELPTSFPVPILIVQHISTGFTQGFVDWMQTMTDLKVKLATDREKILPGYVYIAPEDFHMEAAKEHLIRLVNAPAKGILKPAVSHLFRSLAINYGPHSLGVILTGMGQDGAEELLLMRKSGAITIAQDKESCFMFGMPKEAIQMGAVTLVLPLSHIAMTLKRLVQA